MIRIKISLLVFALFFMQNNVFAQLSNSDLLNIKEQADARKLAWSKAFDEGISNKSFATLPALRTATETYIEEQLHLLNRMYASGDARELLSAVSNYLQIQKQFVKDVMIPAETLNPNDEEGINAVNRRIGDFTNKEKMFLIDINNAIRSTPEPIPLVDQEMNQDDEPEQLSEEEIKKREEAKPHRKGKLPHESANDREKSKTDEDDDEAE